MSMVTVSKNIRGKEIVLETGRLAKLADGAVLVKYDKNAVLVTACMSKECPEGIDFFPLTVNYTEKFYSSGKIPGGYIKREGKPSEKEILVSRLIDRPIRPLFPDHFYNEVQIFATALSADQVYSTDTLGVIGASAALAISPIPFNEPAGGVRIAYLDGEYIVNPSIDEIERSQMDIVVAGTKRGITMVEGGSNEVSKDILLKALEIAQECINDMVDMIEELVSIIKPEKLPIESPTAYLTDEVKSQIRAFGMELLDGVVVNPDKKLRAKKVDEVYKQILEKFEITKESDSYKQAKAFIEELEVEIIRKKILDNDIRPDNRNTKEIRPITVELDILPCVHGSALFTRGQTQSLGIVTLGSSNDVQYIDSIESKIEKRFMLHYNFPPFSTGEVKKMMSVSRREIGHGHLAERSISKVLPTLEEFPYTIRLVSEVLESNGSSSMATVCSSSLSLMAAGVPVKKAVAGIAMGLIWNKDEGKYKILSDIQGLEDHFGDMDFKVAGTSDGITGFQMDVKTIGLTREMMSEAIDQALEGQRFILSKMNEVISTARSTLSENAPKIKSITIPESEIGGVIGGGGRVIKKIMAETQTEISIEDSGKVMISSRDMKNIDKTVNIINHIVNGFRIGEKAVGIVNRVEDYGIFVELIPGQSGLIHKSNLKSSKDFKENYKIGTAVNVVVKDIDERKRLALKEDIGE